MHTDDAKRRIGAASSKRGSAAIALAARWKNKIETCAVVGCGKPHEARSLCGMHYQRLRKTGEIGVPAPMHDGLGAINAYGYLIIERKGEHVRIAENALGKPLPPKAIVHHVDGNRTGNRPTNLVICPNRAYHNLIHARQRALDACGNANWLLCPFCGKYDDPENLYIYPNKRAAKHRECFAQYREERKACSLSA